MNSEGHEGYKWELGVAWNVGWGMGLMDWD